MFRFLQKLFSVDERIDFYAKVICALIATKCTPIDDNLLETVANSFDEKNLFLDRIEFHMDLIRSNELHINQLIRRIVTINKRHPQWINKIEDEWIDLMSDSGSDLNCRVVEFLQNLKTHKTLIYTNQAQNR